MFVKSAGAAAAELRGSVLVLPAMSIGNVGQLAVDALVAALPGMERIGYLDAPVQPVVGLDPFKGADGALALAVEVYFSAAAGVAVVQQRAPVRRNHNRAYAKALGEWVAATGFAHVVVLSGADASFRTDAQLTGSQLRFVAEGSQDLVAQMEGLGWTPMEAEQGLGEPESAFVPRLGFVRALFAALRDRVPVTALFAFCAEGFNIPDGLQVAAWAADLLKLGSVEWVQPPSWQYLDVNDASAMLYT